MLTSEQQLMRAQRETIFQDLIAASRDLSDSEDPAGCSDDLTVVELSSVDKIRAIVDRFDKYQEAQ